MKTKRHTVHPRIAPSRHGVLSDDALRAVTLALLERMHQALDTLLKSNIALSEAVRELAKK